MQSPVAKSFVRVLRGLVVILLLMAVFPAHGRAETLKVAVLPWNVHAGEDLAFLRGALTDMLTTRLGEEAGISVARADRVKEALGAAKAAGIEESTAMGVGKKLGLDYVLYGSVTVIGRAVSLDASLVDVKKGKVIPFASTGPSPDSIVAMADNLARKIVHRFYPERPLPERASKAAVPRAPLSAPAPATVPVPAPVPAPAAQGAPATSLSTTPHGVITKPRARAERGQGAPDFWKSKVIRGQFISMAAADLDGNGEKEFFLLEKNALTVARKDGKELRVVQKIKSTSGLEFVSLAAVDTDGDGTVEIYVSALEHLTAASAVVEYGGGAYSLRKEGIGWLLREARGDDDRPLLLGQRFRSSDGFYGSVDILKKSGSKVVRAGTYLETLPQGVNLYNFTYFNFNVKESSNKYLLAFDKEGRLLVYTRKKRGWSVYWKSKEYYGGTMHRIEFSSDTSSSETYRYVDVERPLFHMDTDGDGHDELIVRQSRAVGLFKRYAKVFKSFSGGTIVSLTWDGEFLTEAWRTRDINGYIADFFIDDLPGGRPAAAPKLVMIVQMDSGILSAGAKSYMLIYDLAITPPPAPPNPLIR